MKLTWRGKWKDGEVTIEAETLQELEDALKELSQAGQTGEISKSQTFPEIATVEGCADAIRALLSTEWGSRPRSMNEIKRALETNALHFSKGTLSGTLTIMTKRGEIRRTKEDGRWKYFVKGTVR